MSQFDCPHCKQPAFSRRDKYLAAKWKILTCPRCDRRVTSSPLLLAGFYLLYLADVIDLGLLAYLTDNLLYLVAMVVIWVILDVFSIYLPLAALRDTKAMETQAGSAEPRALAPDAVRSR